MTTPRRTMRPQNLIPFLALALSLLALPEGKAQTFTYQLNDGFESGSLASFWEIDFPAQDTLNVTVQPTPVRAGSYAVHLVNNYGDPSGSNQRTEMTAAAGRGTLHWGKEYWIGFSFFLKDWEASAYAEMVHQIHAVPHGADFSVIAARDLTGIEIADNVMYFETITFPLTSAKAPGGAGAPKVWSAPVQSDAWYDWVLHVRPAQDSTGFTEIWSNGRMIYQQTGPNVDPRDCAGNDSDPTHYLKVGIYNWPWETLVPDVTRREIVYDEVKIGCVDDGYAGGYSGISPQGLSALSDPHSAPSTLTAAWNTASQVKLSWLDNSGSGFLIERKTGEGGAYAQIGTAAAGATRYLDGGLAANTTYVYRVRASSGSSTSPYSLEATARIEDFTSGGASDFAVQQGTWTTSGALYHLAANGADPINAGLSLLNTPVAGDFVLTADAMALDSGGSWDNVNIVFGYQDASNFYYVNGSESVNSAWNGLFKVVNGTTTRLTGFVAAFPQATWATVRVQRVGQSILVYQNGTLLASVLDTTFMAGKIGFGTAHSGARQAQFTNVSLTQANLDEVEQDFSGGAGAFTVAQGTWSVTGGKYTVTGNGGNVRAAALALLPERDGDEFTVMADGTITSTGSSWDNLNIVLNYQDLNDYYCVNFAESSNGLWNGIFRIQGGTVTPLVTWSQTLVPGTTYTLKVVKEDGVLSAYANNVLLGTATDTTFTDGQIGFGTSHTSAPINEASFDNITVVGPPQNP